MQTWRVVLRRVRGLAGKGHRPNCFDRSSNEIDVDNARTYARKPDDTVVAVFIWEIAFMSSLAWCDNSLQRLEKVLTNGIEDFWTFTKFTFAILPLLCYNWKSACSQRSFKWVEIQSYAREFAGISKGVLQEDLSWPRNFCFYLVKSHKKCPIQKKEFQFFKVFYSNKVGSSLAENSVI